MKDQKFSQAYDKIQPDQRVYDEMLENIKMHTGKKKGKMGRKLLIVAAAAAILTTVTLGGYELWHLPQPKTYEGDAYEQQTESVYHQEQLDETKPEPLGDVCFIQKAVDILKIAGLQDVNTETMRVVRQHNQLYDRQEAEVFFENNDVKTSVKFNAEDGGLLSLSSIDWVEEGEPIDEDPETIARAYYEKLPVQQGYVVTGCEKYDEQYWSYTFCREIEDGLYNSYEMVRVAVNPVNGRLAGCNVFYFPLLDDHRPEDVPLTQEQAENVVNQQLGKAVEGHELESGKVEVVLPNWWFTEDMGGNLQCSKVSRLGWVLHYVDYPDDSEEIETHITVYVDYYTGEILGGGQT